MAGTGLMLEMVENERLCKFHLFFFSDQFCVSNSIAIFTKDEKDTKILFQQNFKKIHILLHLPQNCFYEIYPQRLKVKLVQL